MDAFTIIASALLAGGIASALAAQTGGSDASDKTTPKQKLIGQSFPLLVAENLSGDTVTLPTDTKGQPCILTVAFKQSAQKQIDSWTKHVFEEDVYEDVCYYEIPMLKRIWKLMQGWIDGGMRSGIDVKRHENVITYYGDLRKYKDTLHIEDTRYAYIYLIDQEGVIRFTDHGYASDKGLAAMAETMRALKSGE